PPSSEDLDPSPHTDAPPDRATCPTPSSMKSQERHCLDAAEGGLYDYRTGWGRQRELLQRVAHHEICNRVLFVQHESTYTAGRQTQPEERPFDGRPVIDVDRGGKITWHGPGQLVGYPIVFLQRGVGVVDYVRRVEEAVIRTLRDYGIRTGRVPGRTGVWLASDGTGPERKICAIGVRCAHQTTMHGFALNVNPEFGFFDNIVPCGLEDADVTSIERESGRAPSLGAVADQLYPHLAQLLSFAPYAMSPDIERRAHLAFHHRTATGAPSRSGSLLTDAPTTTPKVVQL
ncbi:lipoyl(octanoyl) transferase, partial [Propionibacterium cyclohexanicum]